MIGYGTRFAAADIEDKAGSALDPGDIVVVVDAPLEAVGSVAGELVAARAPGNRVRIEERGLQQDITRRRLGFGAVAAHDPGEPDDTRLIGNGQHVGLQRDCLLVEQFDGFAGASEAHIDATGQFVQIVDV